MDRKELLAAINQGPITIHMNNGATYTVDKPGEAIVSDIAAHVLYRSEQDSKLHTVILPLVDVAKVFPQPKSE